MWNVKKTTTKESDVREHVLSACSHRFKHALHTGTACVL